MILEDERVQYVDKLHVFDHFPLHLENVFKRVNRHQKHFSLIHDDLKLRTLHFIPDFSRRVEHFRIGGAEILLCRENAFIPGRWVRGLIIFEPVDLVVQVLNLVLENARIVKAHVRDDFRPELVHLGMCWVPCLKQLFLVADKHPVTQVEIWDDEVHKVGVIFTLHVAGEVEEKRSAYARHHLITQQSPLNLTLQLPPILIKYVIIRPDQRHSQRILPNLLHNTTFRVNCQPRLHTVLILA